MGTDNTLLKELLEETKRTNNNTTGADNTLLKELLEETKRANNTRREMSMKTIGAIDEQGRRQIYSS